ncbi:hypothetical protein C8Q79DRAFT_348319 [Trametes meyenii]|nr:hypothetical protein C8Q79DRAFT_348319 [Trametes meyenii]
MRLLNTRSGAFLWVDQVADVSYAIISHVAVEGSDQSYQDILRIQNSAALAYPEDRTAQRYPQNNTVLSDAGVSPTIRRACQLADNAGYEYLWMSACCVDRTDDTELADALNNMWDWHSHASLCYAYLADVFPVNEDRVMSASGLNQFRQSEWHKDPWTLLALGAPPKVVFLAQDWSVLGTKASLAVAIEEVTGIDKEVLRGEKGMHDASVARRMWWASKRRQPLAEEDFSYSLLGLFNVRMPISHGEGPHAFSRLQEEILHNTDDQSILAWHYHHGHDHPDSLLAFAPCCFARSGDIAPLSRADFLSRLGLPTSSHLPPLHFTTSGLSATLPLLPHEIASYPPTTALYEVFGVAARFSDVAILRCEDIRGRLVVLTLDRSWNAQSNEERFVKAVETTLGQRDRVWGYAPVLYRGVVEVRDVRISRGPLVAPWSPSDNRDVRDVNMSHEGRGIGQTLITLDANCRLALEGRGFSISYETTRQEVVDDLYERSRRARRFADVHRFVVTKSLPDINVDVEPNRQGHVATVEIALRRFCLAPPTFSSIRVFSHSDIGSSVNSKLQEGLPKTDTRAKDSRTLMAQYPIPRRSQDEQVLSLVLSKLYGSDAVYSLDIQLGAADKTLNLTSLESSPHAQPELRHTTGSILTQSAKMGKVMDQFPRLPNIRGWTSRGSRHITRRMSQA